MKKIIFIRCIFIFMMMVGVFSVMSFTNLHAEETTTETTTPEDFNPDIKIESSVSTSAMIDKNNNLYTWGYNESFGLGNGLNSVASNHPEKIYLPDEEIPADLFADKRDDVFFVVSQSGKLFVWGEYEYDIADVNGSGLPLIDDYTGYVETPTEIPLPAGVIIQDFYLSQSSYASGSYAVVSTVGDLYMWGSNDTGQLGDGTEIDSSIPTLVDLGTNKVDRFFAQRNFEQIAITTQSLNDLYMWGSNDMGELGLGYVGDNDLSTDIVSTPTLNDQVFSGSVIEYITFNNEFTFYVNNIGQTFYSGDFGTYNVLFKDQTLSADVLTPVLFDPMLGIAVEKIVSPLYLGLIAFITTDKDLYVLGDSGLNIGTSPSNLFNRPEESRTIETRKYVDLGGADVLDFEVMYNGGQYGIKTTNGYYLLGLFTTDNYWWESTEESAIIYFTPTLLAVPNSTDEIFIDGVIDTNTGVYTLITNDDNVYTFGDNYYGTLGLGDFISRFNPTKIEMFEDGELVELSDDTTFGGVVITNPDSGFAFFGITWYWYVLIGGVAYYFLGTKKRKKSLGLK
jgi:hypothetical protein